MMSVRVLSHVWNRSKAKGTTLLVMLAIADCCNDDGFTWYSVTNLSKKARVSPRTLQRSIAQLEHLGELSVYNRRADDSSRHLSNVYMVVLPGAAQTLPAELRGSIEETPRDPAKMVAKTSLKEKLASSSDTDDSTVSADTTRGDTDDIRSVNHISVKQKSARKKRTSKQSPAAALRDTVKAHRYYQAYRAALLFEMVDPQMVTLKNAPAWKDVIDALEEAGVQEDAMRQYILSRQKKIDIPYRFEWLAEDIDKIKPPPPPMPQPKEYVRPEPHQGMTKEELDALVIPTWEEILEMTDPARKAAS